MVALGDFQNRIDIHSAHHITMGAWHESFVDYKTDVAREIIIVLISILIFFVSAQKIVKGLEKYPIVKKLDSFFSRKKM